MKSVTIPTGVATAWSGTFRSFVDGDIFRESNIDLNAGDLAERLAYLKDRADIAVTTTGTQTITGIKTFNVDAGDLTVTGASDFRCEATATFIGTVGFSSEVSASDNLLAAAAFGLSTETLADAAASLSATAVVHRVPTLTSNRVYTLPATVTAEGQLMILVRNRTADAFTATLQTSAAVTLGIVSASNAGWILVRGTTSGNTWRVVAWGGTVTSIDTTV